MNLKMLLSECQWAWIMSVPSVPKALCGAQPSQPCRPTLLCSLENTEHDSSNLFEEALKTTIRQFDVVPRSVAPVAQTKLLGSNHLSTLGKVWERVFNGH